jgi:ketosteroid isomerase-like protein
MQSDNSLQDFCQAFTSKDVGQIVMLFDPKGLCELPLMGQRLVGHGEIREAFKRAFSLIDSCAITSQTLKSAANLTIAEGRLQAKLHRDRHPMNAPLAMVMGTESGVITRLSIYLDARPYRLWCDGPIFG